MKTSAAVVDDTHSTLCEQRLVAYSLPERCFCDKWFDGCTKLFSDVYPVDKFAVLLVFFRAL
jgi:hypothetical protein